MRKIILLTFLGLLLSMAITYCQEFTDKESEIYYKYYEKIFSSDGRATVEEQNKAKQEIASEYGITVEEFDDIHSRKWDSEPTAQDWEIYNKINERHDALPKHSDEASAQIDREIANEYGMPVFMLQATYIRVFYYKYIVEPGQQSN